MRTLNQPEKTQPFTLDDIQDISTKHEGIDTNAVLLILNKIRSGQSLSFPDINFFLERGKAKLVNENKISDYSILDDIKVACHLRNLPEDERAEFIKTRLSPDTEDYNADSLESDSDYGLNFNQKLFDDLWHFLIEQGVDEKQISLSFNTITKERKLKKFRLKPEQQKLYNILKRKLDGIDYRRREKVIDWLYVDNLDYTKNNGDTGTYQNDLTAQERSAILSNLEFKGVVEIDKEVEEERLNDFMGFVGGLIYRELKDIIPESEQENIFTISGRYCKSISFDTPLPNLALMIRELGFTIPKSIISKIQNEIDEKFKLLNPAPKSIVLKAVTDYRKELLRVLDRLKILAPLQNELNELIINMRHEIPDAFEFKILSKCFKIIDSARDELSHFHIIGNQFDHDTLALFNAFITDAEAYSSDFETFKSFILNALNFIKDDENISKNEAQSKLMNKAQTYFLIYSNWVRLSYLGVLPMSYLEQNDNQTVGNFRKQSLQSLVDFYVRKGHPVTFKCQKTFEQNLKLGIPTPMLLNALLNAINNAVCPNRGNANRIKIKGINTLKNGKPGYKFLILDDGVGIPKELLQKKDGIQNIFHQGVSGAGGSGTGTAGIFSLISQIPGAKIKANNKGLLNKTTGERGACISIYLPLIEPTGPIKK